MELRKIRFNKFIPAKYDAFQARIGGTGENQKDFPNEGLFHCWGVVADGIGGTDSIAIVEMEDGTVETPYLKDVKFIK